VDILGGAKILSERIEGKRIERPCPNAEPHPPHEWDFIRACPGVVPEPERKEQE
jgi:hypothetical protein